MTNELKSSPRRQERPPRFVTDFPRSKAYLIDGDGFSGVLLLLGYSKQLWIDGAHPADGVLFPDFSSVVATNQICSKPKIANNSPVIRLPKLHKPI